MICQGRHTRPRQGALPQGGTPKQKRNRSVSVYFTTSIKNKRGSVYIYPRAMHMQPAAMVVAAAPHGLPLVASQALTWDIGAHSSHVTTWDGRLDGRGSGSPGMWTHLDTSQKDGGWRSKPVGMNIPVDPPRREPRGVEQQGWRIQQGWGRGYSYELDCFLLLYGRVD